jgi:hypothetical protein
MINWFDNDLTSQIVDVDSIEDAMRYAFTELNGCEYPSDMDQTVEGIKQYAFDCDGMVNALQID